MMHTLLTVALLASPVGFTQESRPGDSRPASRPASRVAPDEPTGELRTFLGPHLIRVIGGATRVQVFRVDGRPARARPPATRPAGKTIEGYPVLATAPDQGAEFAARLARLLFDPGSYDFAKRKRCSFEPGVVFRLWQGDEHVDVLVCFTCDEWQIVGEPAGQARVSVTEDCDRARGVLLRMALAAFPDDAVLKGLPAGR